MRGQSKGLPLLVAVRALLRSRPTGEQDEQCEGEAESWKGILASATTRLKLPQLPHESSGLNVFCQPAEQKGKEVEQPADKEKGELLWFRLKSETKREGGPPGDKWINESNASSSAGLANFPHPRCRGPKEPNRWPNG